MHLAASLLRLLEPRRDTRTCVAIAVNTAFGRFEKAWVGGRNGVAVDDAGFGAGDRLAGMGAPC